MTTTPPTTETWLNRVNALLAKASSTEFPEEAEALMAKAQALMARHAIDDAMLAAAGRDPATQPEAEAVQVDAPYASAKSALLSTVASANHCRCVMAPAGSRAQRCVIVGHPGDLANVRTLFGALSVHAARSMMAAEVPPHDTPRRFRHAFLLAFTSRIGERLRAAMATAEREASAAGGQGVAVVLAGRDAAVERTFREAFPFIRNATFSSSSYAGARSGRSAAERASLGQAGLTGQRRGLRRG